LVICSPKVLSVKNHHLRTTIPLNKTITGGGGGSQWFTLKIQKNPSVIEGKALDAPDLEEEDGVFNTTSTNNDNSLTNFNAPLQCKNENSLDESYS
jgi:hypothetical protein